jgi:hypothetical protein
MPNWRVTRKALGLLLFCRRPSNVAAVCSDSPVETTSGAHMRQKCCSREWIGSSISRPARWLSYNPRILRACRFG